MKKIYSMLFVIVFMLIICSCSSKVTNYNQVMISVYLEGTNDNKGIEIYNSSEDKISLKNYSVVIYNDAATTIKEQISLKGSLDAKECYVICNPNANDELVDKADLKSEKLNFTGSEAVALMYNKVVCDTIGKIGTANKNQDITYVRKIDRVENEKEFNPYDYIIYGLDNFNYFGEFINSVTPDELLAGPQFLVELLDGDLFEEKEEDVLMGTGYALETPLGTSWDSSSAYFVFPSELELAEKVGAANASYAGGNFSLKVDFTKISTPIANASTIEEWGMPAKNFVVDNIDAADKCYVQSVKNEELLNRNNRISAYVWTQKENNITLLNYEIIKNGYSKLDIEGNYDMLYKDIPYYSYFVNAKLYAELNQLGVFGQKDPTWNYLLDRPKV